MNRPQFLLRPLDWTRVSRTAQTAADYACAVEHNAQRRTEWRATTVMVVLAAGVAVAAFLGVM